MPKVVIGFLPTITINDNDPYQDKYSYSSIFSNTIDYLNATIIGLMPNNKGLLDERVLDLCDGFLLPGGTRVDKCWYQVINYAINKNKPLLGICLGSEAIAIFSAILDRLDSNTTDINKIINIYQELKKENDGTLLAKLPDQNIHSHFITKDNFEENLKNSLHSITIKKNTILASIYPEKEILVPSFHNYDYKMVGSKFIISAYASDGVCEAIEYNNPNYFILGIHFHPEINKDYLIFARFIKECLNRQKNCQ